MCLWWLTSILGPAQDGCDFVPLSGVTPRAFSGRTHSHGALVGLHATQVGSGSARAVRNLSVGVVRLQWERESGVSTTVSGKEQNSVPIQNRV